MRQRGLLLDRDGVVNVDPGYVYKPEQFTFMPGLFAALRKAQDSGYRLAVVTNQSGVARGYFSIEDFEKLTAWMLGELQKEGITVELVLASFEYKDGAVPHLSRESFWRKPNAGMVLEALQRLRLDPARSVMVGDHERDMKAAESGGIGTRLFISEGGKDSLPGAISFGHWDEVPKLLRR